MVATTAAPAASAADPGAAAAMTREPAPADRRAVRAPIVVGDDFHVEVILSSVDIPILDAAIWKMHLAIEEWQVMIVRPLRDLALVAIGPTVSIGSAAITLMEPLLVLALELVVQLHAVDFQSALFQPCCLAFVGAVDLRVVFELAFAFESRVEGLAGISVAVPIRLQQSPAAVCQHDRLLAITRDATASTSPCSRRCRRSPSRTLPGRSSRSRSSRAGTTRKAPTVASERLSDPRSVYSRSRASWTTSRSPPRGRLRLRVNTSRGSLARSRGSRSRSGHRTSSRSR